MPRKRSEQSTIPGMEPKRIKQVHLAGLAYLDDELSVDLTTPDVKVKARLLTDEEEEE